MREVLCALLITYILVLFARALLSWFPPPRSTGMRQVARVLHDLTEPVLAPMRRIIPPVGMIDLSFMVVLFVLFIIWNAVCGSS